MSGSSFSYGISFIIDDCSAVEKLDIAIREYYEAMEV